MAQEVSPESYKDLVLFLATAGIVAPIFKRLKINPILGYLLAGVILGPFGLGRFIHYAPWLDYVTVDNPEEIAQLAEFGVVFLLFMSLRVGPLNPILAQESDAVRGQVREAVAAALEPYAKDGLATMTSACWLVTAEG